MAGTSTPSGDTYRIVTADQSVQFVGGVSRTELTQSGSRVIFYDADDNPVGSFVGFNGYAKVDTDLAKKSKEAEAAANQPASSS